MTHTSSDHARYLAALIRVRAARRLGRKTPRWIGELAEREVPRTPHPHHRTERERFLAATIRLHADKKLRRSIPVGIVELLIEGPTRFARGWSPHPC